MKNARIHKRLLRFPYAIKFCRRPHTLQGLALGPVTRSCFNCWLNFLALCNYGMNGKSKTISLIKVCLQNAALTKCYNGLKKEDPQFVRLFRIHDEKNGAKRYGWLDENYKRARHEPQRYWLYRYWLHIIISYYIIWHIIRLNCELYKINGRSFVGTASGEDSR